MALVTNHGRKVKVEASIRVISEAVMEGGEEGAVEGEIVVDIAVFFIGKDFKSTFV